MANSVDPDQMPHSVTSDLGLHCLLKSIPTLRVMSVHAGCTVHMFSAKDVTNNMPVFVILTFR